MRHEPVPADGLAADDPTDETESVEAASPAASSKPIGPTWRGFSANGLAACGITVAVLGVIMLITLIVFGQITLGIVVLLPVIGCAAALYVLSIRRRLRDAVVEELAITLAKRMELPDPSFLEIDPRQWQGGWIGIPHLLNIHYPDEVEDGVPRWAEDVAETVRLEFGEAYVVGRHNYRARRLTLRDPKKGPGHLTPEAALRTRGHKPAKRRLPDKISRPTPSNDDRRAWLIPLGVDLSGTRVAWNLRGSQGHVLVFGRSGAGKRVLLTGIAFEVALRGWPVWVIDHRRVDMLAVRDWPNVQIVASSLEDQIVVLNQAWREMESRIAMVESGANPRDLEPLVLIIHHYPEFARAVADAAGRANQDASSTSLVPARVSDLLRHGRAVHVFVVLSSQLSDAPNVLDNEREELSVLVAMGKVERRAASKMARAEGWDEMAEPMPGRATIKLGDAKPVLAQCYWTPDPREARRSNNRDDLLLVQALRPQVVAHPALRVQRTRPLTDSPAAAWNTNMAAELVEGRMSASVNLAAWSRAPVSPDDAGGQDDTLGKDAGGWSRVVMVSQLAPGDLARLDDDHGWVMIEQVTPVPTDGTSVQIRWRTNDDAGTEIVLRTRTARVRHMSDGVY